jgi:transketolase
METLPDHGPPDERPVAEPIRPGPTLPRVRALFDATAGDEKHDRSALSVLDVVWLHYDRILRHDPGRPRWAERDRFLLSKGHGPLALYSVLAGWGYLPQAELATFMAWGSRLGGHPDRNLVPGVEISTGSLGHGVPMAVGVALALRAARRDSRAFVLLGDGEANEGSVWESLLAGSSLRLDNLTAILVDDHSSTPSLGDIPAKLEAFGWTTHAARSDDHAALEAALRHREPGRPGAVVVDWSPDWS